MADSVKNTLVEARELIADPKHWVKNTFRRELPKRFWFFRQAPAFCAVGALRQANGPYEALAVKALGAALPFGCGTSSIPSFNDHYDTTHEDILALFDRAIAAQG